MEKENKPLERLIGRETEIRRQSQLIGGSRDAGKTSLIERALTELPEVERRKCIYWTGPASRRQFVEYLIQELYLAGDVLVRKLVVFVPDETRARMAGPARAPTTRNAPRNVSLLGRMTTVSRDYFYLAVPASAAQSAELLIYTVQD